MKTGRPVYKFLFRLSPWILVPALLLLFFLARSLLHLILLGLARHTMNGVRGILIPGRARTGHPIPAHWTR